jgi:hypothetical protein
MSHRHVPPIPDENTHPLKYRWAVIRWRIAVAAVIYPVQVAVALALLICAVPVYLVLSQQADIRHTAEVAKVAASGQRDILARLQANRVKTTGDICKQLDANARTINAQLRLYQGIIVNGAKQGRIFDRLFKAYGAPPYKARVKAAKKQAAKIEHLKLPLPNCTKIRVQVSRGGK